MFIYNICTEVEADEKNYNSLLVILVRDMQVAYCIEVVQRRTAMVTLTASCDVKAQRPKYIIVYSSQPAKTRSLTISTSQLKWNSHHQSGFLGPITHRCNFDRGRS